MPGSQGQPPFPYSHPVSFSRPGIATIASTGVRITTAPFSRLAFVGSPVATVSVSSEKEPYHIAGRSGTRPAARPDGSGL
ncbi:MAG: hypothetical protein KO206_06300 [Methanomicrobiaceae archaeon]|nr:hypothetical protein [Methanomicrobiaceae archaeon]MDD5420276.1 hypothetical protein [Methanomicrobiaceae archaeon]